MTTKSRKNAVVVAKLSGSKADNMPNSLDCVTSPRLPLLNRFFDQVIPAIEAEGGEILKFLGDGVLAIFKHGRGPAADCAAAFAAARSVLSRLDRSAELDMQLSAGITLHHSEVSYGNIGSGHRLDFTVIGPAVNLTSRPQRLRGAPSSSLRMSRQFAACSDNGMCSPSELTG